MENPRTPTYFKRAIRRKSSGDCNDSGDLEVVGFFGSSRTKKERRSSPVIELRSRGPTSWSSIRRADGQWWEEGGVRQEDDQSLRFFSFLN